MDSGEILSESIAYTRETFEGKWARWLILVILYLPAALFSFLFDPEKVVAGGQFRWDLVPWDQVALLLAATCIGSILAAGYMVRIYRGAKPAPDFNDWANLFLDGLKLAIVSLLWFLPILIVILVVLGIAVAGGTSAGTGSMALLFGLVLAALVVEVVVCLVVVLFLPMAVIRFARTGSISEGLRYRKIQELIGNIGWWQYVIALVVLLVVVIMFTVITMVLSLIPYIGWMLTLIVNPVLSVLTARYYTILYDHGAPDAAPAP